MRIVPLEQNFIDQFLQLLIDFWPGITFEEERSYYLSAIGSPREMCFVAEENGILYGLAHVTLRNDHVEGSLENPTAYLEGIFVTEHKRKEGIGMQLLNQVKQWAKEQGRTQLGSDVELDNPNSLDFHKKHGFQIVNQITCLIAPLSD